MNTAQAVKQRLDSQLWRLNNLYWLTDKQGKRFQFRLNWAQIELYERMWYLSLVLKARQIGFTSFIDLFILDTCLFNADQRAGIIAHSLDDAKVIFRDKIKYPYDNLDPGLRTARLATTERHEELLFANNSSIRVATSMRSGTLNILHVSEYGKISARYPDKAREIKTGAFEAVGQGQMIFVESTAEGPDGEFYRLTKRAQAKAQSATPLTKLDFKFFFFPWHRHPHYRLTKEEALAVPIPQRLSEYFQGLADNHGIELSRGQQAWYVKKEETLGEDIKREYPSTPEEAFDASVEGAYFARALAKVRGEQRITQVPHQDGLSVDTWWDLGRNDMNAIWFTQTVGKEVHVIDYYENSGESFPHYAAELKRRAEDLGYSYGLHVGPHDLGVHEYMGPGVTRRETAKGYGIVFVVAPATRDKGEDINAVRNFLSLCVFDQERCEQGIARLDGYRKEWDAVRSCWKDHPRHDDSSHGTDAFMVLSKMHYLAKQRQGRRAAAVATAAPPRGGWT